MVNNIRMAATIENGFKRGLEIANKVIKEDVKFSDKKSEKPALYFLGQWLKKIGDYDTEEKGLEILKAALRLNCEVVSDTITYIIRVIEAEIETAEISEGLGLRYFISILDYYGERVNIFFTTRVVL